MWSKVEATPSDDICCIRQNEYIEFEANSCHKVEVKGFLVIKDVTSQGFSSIWQISPIRDIEEWGQESRVYLGAILVHGVKMKSIPVFLRALKEEKGVTVVDPENNLNIDIASNEILEVVVHSNHKELHPVITGSTDVKSIRLQRLRVESYIPADLKPASSVFFRLAPKSFFPKNKYRHHFWFRLHPRCLNSIPITKSYFVGELKFIGANKIKLHNRLNVFLYTREWQNKLAINRMIDNSAKGIDPIAETGNYMGLHRLLVEEEGLLINPGCDERITFLPEQSHMIIEMVQPNFIYPDLDKGARWKCSSHKRWKCDERVSVEEISPRFINYHLIQRFIVRNLLGKLPDGYLATTLGTIMLTCGEYAIRKLKFDLAKARSESRVKEQRKELEDFFGGVVMQPEKLVQNNALAKVRSTTQHHDQNQFRENCDDYSYPYTVSHTTPTSRKVKVNVEELAFDTLSSGTHVTTMAELDNSPWTKFSKTQCKDKRSTSGTSFKYNKGKLIVRDPVDTQELNIAVNETMELIFSKDQNPYLWRIVSVAPGLTVITPHTGKFCGHDQSFEFRLDRHSQNHFGFILFERSRPERQNEKVRINITRLDG